MRTTLEASKPNSHSYICGVYVYYNSTPAVLNSNNLI